MEELKGRISGVNMAYYVNLRTIEAVHQALDIPLSNTISKSQMNGFRSSGQEEEDGEIVEEEVPMYNDDLWLDENPIWRSCVTSNSDFWLVNVG